MAQRLPELPRSWSPCAGFGWHAKLDALLAYYDNGGLAVTELKADAVAARAGIQKGDILVGLHSWEMLTQENVLFVLNHQDLASFNPLRFYIIRAGQVHRGWIQQVE